jgi:uncharacterized protein with von Willebrand factor type A (vWA) domain/carbon monoxide dehydrogenase subunit G
LFEQAFDVFWRNPKLLEKMVAAMLPRVYSRTPDAEQPELPSRLAQAMLPPKRPESRPDDEDEVELDAAFTFSPREVLQAKDFATMTADELAQVKVMLARLKLPLPQRPVRRTHAAARGHRIDLRATLRGMTGAAGAVAPLAFRARIHRTPPLVVLCDISGSMDRYARMLLHFLHAITNDRHRVHTLVFGTRLTNITRHLKHRDVDVALERVSESVQDWAGGTRIGASLEEFNRRWSRRLLGQNAVVLLISDGLDAECGGLEFEVERLAKSCARLVWLNPLLRYAGFEARRPAFGRCCRTSMTSCPCIISPADSAGCAVAARTARPRGRARLREGTTMEMTKTLVVPASVHAVWHALNDPAALKSCIPGCESLEKTDDDMWRARLTTRVGPVSAKVHGTVRMTDSTPPTAYTLKFEGQGGAAGFANGEARVTLVAVGEDQTKLTYTAKAQVGGKLAQIGSRLIDGAAAKLAGDFFERFNARFAPAATPAETPAALPGKTPVAAPAKSRRRRGAQRPRRLWRHRERALSRAPSG